MSFLPKNVLDEQIDYIPPNQKNFDTIISKQLKDLGFNNSEAKAVVAKYQVTELELGITYLRYFL